MYSIAYDFNSESSNKILRANLELILLAMLYEEPTFGYRLIQVFHNAFGVLLSPSTIYTILRYFEQQKLVKVLNNNRKKIYSLTPKGDEVVHVNFKKAIVISNRITFFLTEKLTNTK